MKTFGGDHLSVYAFAERKQLFAEYQSGGCWPRIEICYCYREYQRVFEGPQNANGSVWLAKKL